MEKAKRMMTYQRKITTARRTDTKTRKVDPHVSQETRREDGRPQASRKMTGKSHGACCNCVKTVHEAETVGVKRARAKANRKENGDTS